MTDSEADKKRDEILRRMLKTPPVPHKKQEKDEDSDKASPRVAKPK